MKRFIFYIIFSFVFSISLYAATPSTDLDKVLNAFDKSQTLEAVITVNSGHKGKLIMKNQCFKLDLPEIKCWFNGTTLWTYSSQSSEVNITEPTSEELMTISPYAILINYKTKFSVSYIENFNNNIGISLIPKDKSFGIKEYRVYINKFNYRIARTTIVYNNGTSQTVDIKYLNSNQVYQKSIFSFNKKEVPAGTELVDLR